MLHCPLADGTRPVLNKTDVVNLVQPAMAISVRIQPSVSLIPDRHIEKTWTTFSI